MEIKLCVDCFFYVPPPVTAGGGYGVDTCRHKHNSSRVTGAMAHYTPEHLRETVELCGPTGTWWEEKLSVSVAAEITAAPKPAPKPAAAGKPEPEAVSMRTALLVPAKKRSRRKS